MQDTLDIELLRTFQAIVRFNQFLAASTWLNRSPSAVSLHVRRLEELAGGRLFERDNQTVSLTALGRRFALQSAELLHVHDRMLASFSEPSASGRVRLGISEEYAGAVLQCTLSALSTRYPQIELEVETGASGRLSLKLARGHLDLALVVEPVGVKTPSERLVKKIGTTEPVWVASHDYRVDTGKPLPLALHGKGCPYRIAAVDALTEQGQRWRAVVSSAGVSALQAAIEAGLAVGIVDRALIGPGMRVLEDEEGFPPLPLHEMKLILAPGETSEACAVMAQLMCDHFHG
ncbi:LysR substrate-binding domain-containing protein [Pseudomonas huanghezhanensis]|uniref:LysR substrate-binding domain-containing protein n=1 Tax=Pseudomonas huanghezhanensis TaxID=3002903 RepID=UPI0022856ECB|nr:LysR substrate-binding domain-containing protein [Pseudomonas sp. BSw22131]